MPGNIRVINPMPGARSTAVEPGMEGLITLTTCHPQFSNAERMIIHAVRTDVQPKNPGAGLPAAMKEVR
ncbi:sortase (surface protein transpeptidase) [Corynebacterium mucifaciens]|uniref:Sortase (Surface protein transpeptidase) n=1 Tax=Corynebacterium mucifaciens TaxID=57171 RepID=A0ABV2NYG6_9CORY